jgi:hypothetical protein
VERFTITCENCQRHWTLPATLTVYEKRALRALPCSHCGTKSLTCNAADDKPAAKPRVLAGRV